MEAAGLILLFLFLALVIRLAAGSMDGSRVEDYIRQRGGRLLSSNWTPFGRGWFGEKSDRIYTVRYEDAAGHEHEAQCKTSLLSGVYFTEDRIVREAMAPPVPALVVPAPPPANATFLIHGLDHVQLAMPPGQEDAARRFYCDLLGLAEVPKPVNLAARGGVWFQGGSLRLHLGVETDFRPARKAHPALLVENLPALVAHLGRNGIGIVTDEPLAGYNRAYVADPFGNRIELLEPA